MYNRNLANSTSVSCLKCIFTPANIVKNHCSKCPKKDKNNQPNIQTQLHVVIIQLCVILPIFAFIGVTTRPFEWIAFMQMNLLIGEISCK